MARRMFDSAKKHPRYANYGGYLVRILHDQHTSKKAIGQNRLRRQVLKKTLGQNRLRRHVLKKALGQNPQRHISKTVPGQSLRRHVSKKALGQKPRRHVHSSRTEAPMAHIKDNPRTETPPTRLEDKHSLERNTEVPRPLLQEDMLTCSYVMLDEVVNECPLGHLLNPGLSSLNVRTGILTVTCPECDITLYMKTDIMA